MNGPHFSVKATSCRHVLCFSLAEGTNVCNVMHVIHSFLLLCPCAAQEFLTHEGYFVPDSSGNPVGSTVARGDVARFMLSLLNSNAWIKGGVSITTK